LLKNKIETRILLVNRKHYTNMRKSENNHMKKRHQAKNRTFNPHQRRIPKELNFSKLDKTNREKTIARDRRNSVLERVFDDAE
jgi:hypothetical protein